MSRTLTLNLNGVYFDQILAGEKVEEYRLESDYWRKRIARQIYDEIVLLRGYPKGGGVEGETRLSMPWRGWSLKTLTHEHFGPDPVTVYAIAVGYGGK